jgi:hypothetical protein
LMAAIGFSVLLWLFPGRWLLAAAWDVLSH